MSLRPGPPAASEPGRRGQAAESSIHRADVGGSPTLRCAGRRLGAPAARLRRTRNGPTARLGRHHALGPSRSVGRSARSSTRDRTPVTVVKSATPEGETNLVRVLGLSTDARLRDRARVQLAILPHGSTGGVSRSALGPMHSAHRGSWSIGAVSGRRSGAGSESSSARGSAWDRRAGPRPGVSSTCARSSRGSTIRSTARSPSGRSARSRVLTDWPGGGYIGIHGTDRPDLIPGRISHGCIRLRNADALRLAQLMPLGTPVTIV